MTWAHGRRAGDVPGTIPQVLDRIADQFADHDALVSDGRRLTYAQLRDEVRRVFQRITTLKFSLEQCVRDVALLQGEASAQAHVWLRGIVAVSEFVRAADHEEIAGI